MNGNINILFATKQILKDLDENIFKFQAKKAYKKNEFQLLNLSTIVTLGLDFIEKEDYEVLFDSFVHKPFMMNFV